MSDSDQAIREILNIYLSKLNEEGLKNILDFTRAFAKELEFRKVHP